jgi:hypothetical protein
MGRLQLALFALATLAIVGCPRAPSPQPRQLLRANEFACVRDKARDAYGMEFWACARFTGGAK